MIDVVCPSLPYRAETESDVLEQVAVGTVGSLASLTLIVIVAPGGIVPAGMVTSPITP